MAPVSTSGVESMENVASGSPSGEGRNNRRRRDERAAVSSPPTVQRPDCEAGPSSSSNALPSRRLAPAARGSSELQRSVSRSPLRQSRSDARSPRRRPNPNAADQNRAFTLDDEIRPGKLVRDMRPDLIRAMGLVPPEDSRRIANILPRAPAPAVPNNSPPSVSFSLRDFRRASPPRTGSESSSISPRSRCSSGIGIDEPLSESSPSGLNSNPKRVISPREAKSDAPRVQELERPESGSSGISAGTGSKSPTPSPSSSQAPSRPQQELSSQQGPGSSSSRPEKIASEAPVFMKMRPCEMPKNLPGPKHDGFPRLKTPSPSRVSAVPGIFRPLMSSWNLSEYKQNSIDLERWKRAVSPKAGASRLLEEKQREDPENPVSGRPRAVSPEAGPSGLSDDKENRNPQGVVTGKRKAETDLEEAVKQIKEAFGPLQEENHKKALEEFSAMRTALKLAPNPYKNKDFKPIPFNWSTEELKTTEFKSSPAQPKMKHFFYIERSFQTEECFRLPNLPYIEDVDERAKLVTDLKDLYPDGIHGQPEDEKKKKKKKQISDYVLYKIIKNVGRKWNGKAHIFCEALYKLFPDKYTLSQFKTIWPLLVVRFEGPKLVDNKNMLSVAESIEKYICIKCRMYNCLIHKLGENPPKPKGIPQNQPIQRQACSTTCFIYFPDVKSPHSLLITKEERIQNQPGLVEVRPFTDPLVKSMFEKLVRINRNSCQLASMVGRMEARTCQEMYRLIQSVKKDDDGLERKRVKNPNSTYARIYAGNLEINERIVHCNHEGECRPDREDCPCLSNNVGCFKYCRCSAACKRKFAGCNCSPGRCNTDYCPCFYAKRECDPALCGSCNSGTQYVYLKNPIPEEEEPPEPIRTCKNVQVQRGAWKKVRVARSGIAGNGLFLAEDAAKDDLIGEYVGEMITQDEANRRGRVYDAMGLSYTFDLNKEQVLDAYRFGNPMRFANHSQENPNCYTKAVLVDGEQRIGIFAMMDIKNGEELLFDYRYEKGWTKKFCNIEKGSSKQKKKK